MSVAMDQGAVRRTHSKQQTQRFRCAIYTRKSTDEGLDQDFNSLDAQREACAAYIKSQGGLGWKIFSAHYDDGGISGGTMDRPALTRLLDDIKQGLIDIVVVYKIDRLTRSLMDFAKMVEVFDDKGVSFVSVTQQFNTTTSMGRLTLNVLLSFAQFEREVTAERIKDKIAASKKKGMWMGGVVPLGYKVEHKKLVIHESEAKTVRWLFQKYLELGSVNKLSAEANSVGLSTRTLKQKNGKTRKTAPFGRGNLYHLLSNPIYIGKIRHQDKVHDGQHKAIINQELWNAVQDKIATNTKKRQSNTNTASSHLLTGLIYDGNGNRILTNHTVKNGKRYHYYISQKQKSKGEPNKQTEWRIPVNELERPVIKIIRNYLTDQTQLIDSLNLRKSPILITKSILQKSAGIAKSLKNSSNSQQEKILATLLKRVILPPAKLIMEINPEALIEQKGNSENEQAQLNRPIHKIEAEHQIQRRGVEAKSSDQPAYQHTSP